jgi:dCTP deaminase
MSVLAHSEILARLQNRDLVISPILEKAQLGDISVDLRMGATALIVKGGGLAQLDPREYLATESDKGHSSEHGKRQKLDRFDIAFQESLILHPGSLVLVPTLEWVRLPNDLKGVVTARSSWAREGLSIATATFIDPGYTGVITLELANLGQVPMALYPGIVVAQIAFYRVEGGVREGVSRQFQLSFEPTAGRITKGSEAFIPRYRKHP